ncbi:MAG: helix-turn-helix domain-containing protein [Terriglobia bacterium]
MGRRLRAIRIQQGLTQTDLEKKAGLLRSHISRVENGWRTPSVETLERLATALEVPLYSLFYPAPPALVLNLEPDAFLSEIGKILLRLNEADRKAVLHVARKMADRSQL